MGVRKPSRRQTLAEMQGWLWEKSTPTTDSKAWPQRNYALAAKNFNLANDSLIERLQPPSRNPNPPSDLLPAALGPIAIDDPLVDTKARN
jgi:hypothetical protein